jgi:hypothetical protein
MSVAMLEGMVKLDTLAEMLYSAHHQISIQDKHTPRFGHEVQNHSFISERRFKGINCTGVLYQLGGIFSPTSIPASWV